MLRQKIVRTRWVARLLEQASTLPRWANVWRVRIGVAIVATLASASVALAAAPGTWGPTGAMNTRRTGHVAATLANGNVLVIGGDAQDIHSQSPPAEVYITARGAWSLTRTNPVNIPFSDATLTLLANGNVLLAGGIILDTLGGQHTLVTAERYDPARGTFDTTASLSTARSGHTATLLPGGQVLLVGGVILIEHPPYGTEQQILNTAELYDPTTGSFSTTGSLNTPRSGHTATLLPSGKVLVAGGLIPTRFFPGSAPTPSAELYDPATGTWTVTGNMPLSLNRQTATLLASGKVLLAGGADASGPVDAAELYDPASGTWSATGSLVTGQRQGQTASLVADGTVLVAGGIGEETFNGVGFLATIFTTAELYDPTTGTWRRTGNLVTARTSHTATLLSNGSVLVAGGSTPSTVPPPPTNTAELYTPSTTTRLPSSCVLSGSGKDAAGHSFITIAARDIASGLNSVQLVQSTNTTVALPRFPSGSRDPAVVTATKIDQTQRSTVTLSVTNAAGQSLSCDPVIADLVRQRDEPALQVFNDLPGAESKLTFTNGEPGFNELTVLVNDRAFRLRDLEAGEPRTLDAARAMHAGSTNTITVFPHGPRDSSAELVISD